MWPRGWVDVWLYSSMTTALEEGEWSAARPGPLYPRERPGTHFTGGWVGPRAGLDGRKISSPPGLDPGPSSPVAQSLYRLSYRAHSILSVIYDNRLLNILTY